MTWLIRLTWVLLPVTLGDLLASVLDRTSAPVTWVASVLSWAVWAAGLLAGLTTQPWALLLLRIVAPGAVVGGIVAASQQPPGTLGWVGLVLAVASAATAMSADVGHEFINGASYGDEQRFPLRPPAILVFGPIGLVWALTAIPLPVAALTLASRQWLLGASLAVIGGVTAWWGVRVLARLIRRWCVFVPAGVTLVDEMALADPVLMRSGHIASIGPAPIDTSALDLSVGASGLIVQIDLDCEVDFTPASPRGGTTAAVQTRSVLLAPSRPGRLIRHCRATGLGTARDAV